MARATASARSAASSSHRTRSTPSSDPITSQPFTYFTPNPLTPEIEPQRQPLSVWAERLAAREPGWGGEFSESERVVGVVRERERGKPW